MPQCVHLRLSLVLLSSRGPTSRSPTGDRAAVRDRVHDWAACRPFDPPWVGAGRLSLDSHPPDAFAGQHDAWSMTVLGGEPAGIVISVLVANVSRKLLLPIPTGGRQDQWPEGHCTRPRVASSAFVHMSKSAGFRARFVRAGLFALNLVANTFNRLFLKPNYTFS
jgi:hypothetical protein